jgi:hypothetical protein
MAGGAAEHMGTYVRQDQITEKLEIARTMGLVTDFSITPTGSPRRPDATVRVFAAPQTSDDALKDYLACLLRGLVSEHHIVVTRRFAKDAAPALKSRDAVFASTQVSAAA